MTTVYVPWHVVFHNPHPVEVEIGPGRGEVLLATAAGRSTTNYFAIEQRRGAADALACEATARGVSNVRVLRADARFVVTCLVPDASVHAFHINFPDPWPKRRHHRRRLIDPDFAGQLQRTLVPGGVVHLATDLPALLEGFATTLAGAGLVRTTDVRHSPTRPLTVYERRYATGGTYRARFVRMGAPAPEAGDERC